MRSWNTLKPEGYAIRDTFINWTNLIILCQHDFKTSEALSVFLPLITLECRPFDIKAQFTRSFLKEDQSRITHRN